jgi:hypothetical protein
MKNIIVAELTATCLAAAVGTASAPPRIDGYYDRDYRNRERYDDDRGPGYNRRRDYRERQGYRKQSGCRPGSYGASLIEDFGDIVDSFGTRPLYDPFGLIRHLTKRSRYL